MTDAFSAGEFLIRYKEENIREEILWENHCHAGFEMIAVLTGDIRITLESREYRLTAGDAIIIPPLCYHTISANKKSPYRRLTADFGGDAIPAPISAPFYSKPPFPFRTSGGILEELAELFFKAERELYSPLAMALMVELLYAAYSAEDSESQLFDDPLVSGAVEYIDSHLCEELSLSAVAERLSTSKSLLCHRFKEKMKISPKQYIIKKRLALAAKLIREGASPTEAALFVGYDNYSNFYRMYKKHLNILPSER